MTDFVNTGKLNGFKKQAFQSEKRAFFLSNMYEDYNDYNKIEFYGSWGRCYKFDWDQSYKVIIYNDCSNPLKAASILQEHGGRYYQD